MGWTRERSRSHAEDIGLAKIRQVRALKKRKTDSSLGLASHTVTDARLLVKESTGMKQQAAESNWRK